MSLLTDSDQVYRFPAWKIAKAVNDKELAASYVANIFLDRIESLNPALKAWKFLDTDYVKKQVNNLDINKIYPLNAVPIGIKDIFNTEVLPTEMGSVAWKGHMAGNDARCVSYLRDRGAIVFGKTDTAEFAVHHPGECLNPWNKNRVTGTSSGGSAVAVATAMAPLALATQTAGSTIRPASWCGVYGMKPSFGLIPRTGVLKTTDTLDNIGFYGRDIQDLRLLLDSMRVHGNNFPIMEKRFAGIETDKKQWKVGLVKGHLWGQAPEYVKSSFLQFSEAVDKLPGVSVHEVDLPNSSQDVHNLHHRVYDPCLAYYFRDELEHSPDKISKTFLSQVERGQKYSPEDYKYALEEQSALASDLEYFFEDNEFDVLLHYSSNGSAPEIEPDSNLDLNMLWTLSWLPVINIPGFFCSEGLPFGMQAIGSRYSDYRLFSFLNILVDNELIPSIAELAPVAGKS